MKQKIHNKKGGNYSWSEETKEILQPNTIYESWLDLGTNFFLRPQKTMWRDFPDGPVANIPCSQCSGLGFNS